MRETYLAYHWIRTGGSSCCRSCRCGSRPFRSEEVGVGGAGGVANGHGGPGEAVPRVRARSTRARKWSLSHGKGDPTFCFIALWRAIRRETEWGDA